MRILLFLALVWTAGAIAAGAQQTIIFVDGTRIAVQSFEIKGGTVQFTTSEGSLRSVPRGYVDFEATELANGGGRGAPSPPMPMPAEVVEPPRPMVPPEPLPERDADPPPPWSNDDLKVSLQIPSAAWRLEDGPASYDVAVAVKSDASGGRATLALVRQKIRGEKDFRRVLSEIEASISGSPGYEAQLNSMVALEPYIAHEFRFTKKDGAIDIYNRLIVVYSEDLAYVLSLVCPESRLSENQADFDALAHGLVIRKPSDQLKY